MPSLTNRGATSTPPEILVELWRGDFLENVHRGHVVIADHTGQLHLELGDPEVRIFPRSSIKMIQALPLVESGAAARAGLTGEHLALACASHIGGEMHTSRVRGWLKTLGLAEDDLRCGAQTPDDTQARHGLRAEGKSPGQVHNVCSGKHCGFLTLSRHLGGGPEYIEPDHPVQIAVRQAIEEMAEESSPGFGIDGCSAPNFVLSLKGYARALARMGKPETLGATRGAAANRVVGAMAAHPLLLDGAGKATTELTIAAKGKAVVKYGANGVYSAILPGQGIGIALKIADGNMPASEAAIAALLVRLGVLDANDPAVTACTRAPVLNRRGIHAATLIACATLF